MTRQILTYAQRVARAAYCEEQLKRTRGWPDGHRETLPPGPLLDEEFGDNVMASLIAGDVACVALFARGWRGERSTRRRRRALSSLVQVLAHAAGFAERPVVEWRRDLAVDGSPARGAFHHHDGQSLIELRRARPSIITTLHEFAHANGFGEHGAVWYSTNVFRAAWPSAFSRLVPSREYPWALVLPRRRREEARR